MATYKKFETKDGAKVQVDSAIRDGEGKNIANNYVKQSGYYQTMRVGLADNLASQLGDLGKTPFASIRSSGGSSHITTGNALFQKLVGTSIVWNQLCKFDKPTNTINGITFTNNNDGSFTVNGTATADAVFGISSSTLPLTAITGHKYLLKGCPANGSSSTYYLTQNAYTSSSQYDTGDGVIYSQEESSNAKNIVIVVKNGTTIDNLVFRPQLFDLTLMFGNDNRIPYEILNGITENSVSISGITIFNRMFSLTSYANDDGTIKSSKPNTYDIVGYNAFDGELEHGRYNTTTGLPDAGYSEYVRNVNKIKVIPSQKYTISRTESCLGYLYEYDGSQNFIKSTYINENTTNDLTLTNNTHYINFSLGNTFTTTLPTNVCVHLTWSGSKTGYEAHYSRSYSFGGDELKGIVLVNSSNNTYSYGDEKTPNGTITRKFGIVDLGTKSWSIRAENSTIRTSISDILSVSSNVIPMMICSKYTIVGSYYGNDSTDLVLDKSITVWASTQQIVCKDTELSLLTPEEIQTALSGVYLVYELDTPTTENGNQFDETTLIDDYGTQEISNAVSVGLSVPCGNNIFYQINLQNFLQATYQTMDGNASNFVTLSGNNNFTGTNEFANTKATSLTIKSGQANMLWKYYSGNDGYLRLARSTDNGATFNDAISLDGSYQTILPASNNFTSLGSSSKQWKDLYLSGTTYLGTNGWNFYNSGTNLITKIGNVYKVVFGAKSFSPYSTDRNIDLGNSSGMWRDLYVNRNISDGTNSVSVSQIAGGLFNVINASDIVSNTLTDEQYALITNGKPTLIKGGLTRLLYPGLVDGAIYVGLSTYANYGNTDFLSYSINTTTKVIGYGSGNTARIHLNGNSLNGKAIPAYPSNTGTFVLKCVNGTLTWVAE